MQFFHGQIFVFTIFTLFHGHSVLFHGHFTLFHGHFEVKSFSRPKRFFTAKDPCGQRTPKVRPNAFPGSEPFLKRSRPESEYSVPAAISRDFLDMLPRVS